jgi:hypothetical protein
VKVYPNPANGPVAVEVSIPGGTSGIRDVKLVLHDLLGRTVATCYDGTLTGGVHVLGLDLSQAGIGVDLASGVYFLRMQAGSETIGEIVKVAVIK